jgi:hypothetical protein
MENNQESMAKTEALMAEFVFEMHQINEHAAKLEKAYHSTQKRFEEITKLSETMLVDVEETAKKNEKILSEIKKHAGAITTQAAHMESDLKAIASMEAFLNARDVPKIVERMRSFIKIDMEEISSRFDELLKDRLQEMLPKLVTELKKNYQPSPIPKAVNSKSQGAKMLESKPVKFDKPPDIATKTVEKKSISEWYESIGSFPFWVVRNKWSDDYCYRVDNIVSGQASGYAFKSGEKYKPRERDDANERIYNLVGIYEFEAEDDLPF